MNTTTANTASTASTASTAKTVGAANTANVEITVDSAAAARHERFGKLPERVPYQDMVEVRPASPNESARDAYDPEGSWMSFSCLAADLGL
ncbi:MULTISPECIES: hypothetical protein [unclassified Streptomyces]|uniref:hypothetical protein n=1 Tax=unclassified Streptomyces TaxID=2593676 RepID=UPI002B1E8EC3|nr:MULTISPECIES: hypothetical protein [unclassified Streptomyces]